MIEIAASFSKKINLQNYGGRAFESEDVFISAKDNLPDGSSPETLQTKTDELYYSCVNAVEAFVKERIELLRK